MYGWRGLIGLINPTYRGRLVAEWYAMLPQGVGLIPCTLGISRGEQDIFSKSFELAEKIARDLALWGADVIVQPGLPPWLVKGPAFEKEWVARLEAETKVPMVTPAGATVRAMQALGLKRVVMATYFGDELNWKIADGLRGAGIEMALMEGYRLSEETEGLYTTPLMALNRVGPDEVYRFVRSLCQKARESEGQRDRWCVHRGRRLGRGASGGGAGTGSKKARGLCGDCRPLGLSQTHRGERAHQGAREAPRGLACQRVPGRLSNR
jgi:maleate cis-trans isomerase